MRIVCPSCDAIYDVPLDRLAPGRGVRCAKCGTVWQPVPTPDPDPPLLQPEPPALAAAPLPELEFPQTTPPPPEPPHPTPAPRRSPPALLAAWLVSVAILFAAGSASIAYRTPIMHAWPPSIRAYAALGLMK